MFYMYFWVFFVSAKLWVVFNFMEKYKCERGMKTVNSGMTDILLDKEIGTNNDRALLYNYRAAYENIFTENITKAISLENKALSFCIPEANPILAANLNMNLDNLYFQKNELDRAKKYMETAINLMIDANTPTADLIIMTRNYADLLYMRGEKMQALNALMKCSEFAKNNNHTEYAALLYAAAVINVDLKNFRIFLSGKNGVFIRFLRAFGICDMLGCHCSFLLIYKFYHLGYKLLRVVSEHI